MQSIATLLTGFLGTIVAVDQINILLLGTVRKRFLRAILVMVGAFTIQWFKLCLFSSRLELGF